MPARDHRRQRQLDRSLLAEHDGAQGGAGLAQAGRRPLERRHRRRRFPHVVHALT
jgi:hypothetical protein